MASSILAFKFRLYPTRHQVETLELQLREACWLYNACIQERRDAWKMARVRITFRSQDAQLKEIRAAGDLGLPSSDAATHIVRRADRAFTAFYRRCRSGRTPGYPRFKSFRRFDSIGIDRYRDPFAVLHGDKFHWPGVGAIKAKLHRPITGRARTVLIKREAHRWFLVVTADGDHGHELMSSGESVGIDVGLASFAVTSDGATVAAPQHLRRAERSLRVLQRRVARCQRGSNRRRGARAAVARSHVRVRNLRSEFHHQLSRQIVNRFGLIAVEDLNIKGLARTRLAKSIHDAGWGLFLDKLAYKAVNAGREFVKVDPRGTSQTCLCGACVPKTLADRWHECPACGLSAPRDLVSAQLIERLGRSRQALTPALASVVCEAQRGSRHSGGTAGQE